MARSIEGRQRRLQRLRQRLAATDKPQLPRCQIIGCGKKVHGLAIALCRTHLLRRQRWGSAICPPPSAAMLKPYLRAALATIHLTASDTFVSAALNGLQSIMDSSGAVVIATRLRGLSPERRARCAWARLREAGVKPERLLAIALAVHAFVECDPALSHRIREWTLVAIGKAGHRIARNQHPVWEIKDERGRVRKLKARRAFPRSSGRVLRHLGEAIEKQCEWVIDRRLAQVVALKVARDGARGGPS